MQLAAAKCRHLSPAIAVLLMLFNGCGTNEIVLEDVFERIYSIESNTSISIKHRDGAVLVYGSDANEMRVRAIKKAYSRQRLNQIAIDISTKPDTVSVTTKFPPQPKWGFSDRSGTVDYTIVVPATASISALDLNAGEVFLEGMRGREVRARINDGRVFARNCLTNAYLTMNRGTITLSYDWWEEQKFSAKATITQGNAWLFLPTDAAFHLIADTAHGKIANDFNDLPVSANAKGMRVDQVVNGGGQAIIETRVDKGDIKIAEANP